MKNSSKILMALLCVFAVACSKEKDNAPSDLPEVITMQGVPPSHD